MRYNFEGGKYVWALFIGHLLVEKLLKALCARTMGKEVPKTHNLVRLAELAGIEMQPEQRENLARLTLFNVHTRYPDWQRQFGRSLTGDYTEAQMKIVGEMKEWLLRMLLQP